MAEKGTLIADQAGGVSIATRDAIEQDDQSNARVIQRLDLALGHLPTVMGDPTRTAVAVADASDVANFPADLTDNLITCGDKARLIVMAEGNGTDISYIDITPIVYDNEATPGVIGTLAEKRLTNGNIIPYRDGVGGTQMLSDLVSWDLNGAAKIGLNVTGYSVTGTTDVWGYVI